MKRLVVFTLATVFVLGALRSADALEVKVSGTWEVGIGWADNTNFTDAKQGGHVDPFGAAQRIRPQFEFISSEALSALLEFEIGTTVWGSNEDGSGGALDADQTDVLGVRRAYIDWMPEESLSLRMGIQGVALPSAAFGSPILDTDVAGVVANYRFTDAVSLTGFWLRPFDRTWNTDGQTDGKNSHDEMDIFGFTLPVKGAGFSVTPWAMYGRAGNDSGYWEYRFDRDRDPLNPMKGTSNMWWAGAAVAMDMLAPLSINLDAMYGSSKSGNSEEAPEFSGFLLAALIEYKTDSMWGNPGLIGWYASGDDASDYQDGQYGKFGRMPIISTDRAGFAPTAYGFAGSMGCMQDGLLSSSGVGTWGLGVQLDGFSFVDKLSHTLRAAYIRGTNDAGVIRNNPKAERFGAPYNIMGDTVYMTEEDYAVEFDLISTYEVSENVTLYLETNYINLELDSSVWGRNAETSNAWKVQFLFEYTF